MNWNTRNIFEFSALLDDEYNFGRQVCRGNFFVIMDIEGAENLELDGAYEY